jgi:hypothetical protein
LATVAFESICPPRSVGLAGDIPDCHFPDLAAADGGDALGGDAMIHDRVVVSTDVVVDHGRVVVDNGRLVPRQAVPVRMRIAETAIVDEVEAIPTESEAEAHAHA